MTDVTDTSQVSSATAEPSTGTAAAPATPRTTPPPLPPQNENLPAHDWKAVYGRFLPLAAAAVFGVLGGVAATSGYYERFEPTPVQQNELAALGETVRRLETNIGALSTSVGTANKASSTQLTRIGERLDKMEKSVAEPAGRMAALTESIEKLRAATSVAKAASGDVTGTIQASERATTELQKPRLAGWVLHDVDRGVATVEGRQGIFDVMVGDALPGLDRVEAIRRQDGKWVVVTRKGTIVAR